jgi:prepilin-type N-terminal cleavage/methylation domain-containing protein
MKASRSDRQAGFTLIELLMVIAVILILAGITFGISRGVQNAQARAQAKAELAVIAQALEQFKSRYGDYPWAAGNPGAVDENGEQLFKALGGYMTFDTSGADPSFGQKASAEIPATGPKSFIDATKISLNNSSLPTNPTIIPDGFRFIDPWGNAYVYRYKSGKSDGWERFGYILYSIGSDGAAGATIPASGEIPEKDDASLDNIYVGE